MNTEQGSQSRPGCFLTILACLTLLGFSDYLTGPLRGRKQLSLGEHALIWCVVLLPMSVYLWLVATRENFPRKTVFWIGFPIILAVYLLISSLFR
jgi:hypothetical protein